MKKIIILGAALLAVSATSAHEDSTKTRVCQVSFFYPLGTNGLESTKYVNNISFNVLTGVNGGLNGVEFGGLVNTNTGNVFGGQFAGIANVNGGTADGFIAAGITNIIRDSSTALVFAGIANVIGGNARGIHGAGISNTVNGNFNGAQGAGISNIVNGNVYGLQVAGISNLSTGDFIGVQASGITNLIGGNLIGGQFSLINRAKKVTGTQVGLINIADSYERGAPIGLINFVRDGYHAIEFSAEEAIYANLKLKLGTERFYGIYKGGFTQSNGSNLLTYGLGFGSMLELGEKSRLSLELSANHLVRENTGPELELLNKADFSFRYNFGQHLTVFGGPSINVYVTENSDETAALNAPYTIFQENFWSGTGSTSLWVGAQGGVALNF